MAVESDGGTDFWNTLWADAKNRSFWTKPAPEILAVLERYPPALYPRLLDLGCGLGRHAMAAAHAGYRVTASDASVAAIGHLNGWARQDGLGIEARVCPFTEDWFGAEEFDIILAVNVLYHGTARAMERAMANIRRWLRHGGLLYFTCPSWQDEQYAPGKQIAPHTFEFEPGHVHHCACEEELHALLAGFEVNELTERVSHFEKEGKRATSCRWQVLARRI